MARVAVFAADEIAIVHVMNRTMRRCFLLGDDTVRGRNCINSIVNSKEKLATIRSRL